MKYNANLELIEEDPMPISDNAERINTRAELLGPSLDANSIENFEELDEESVIGYGGKEIGVKSVPKRKRRSRTANYGNRKTHN